MSDPALARGASQREQFPDARDEAARAGFFPSWADTGGVSLGGVSFAFA